MLSLNMSPNYVVRCILVCLQSHTIIST